MTGMAREQVDDHLRAPVRHLAPGQQVADEGLGHQAQVDQQPKIQISSRGFR